MTTDRHEIAKESEFDQQGDRVIEEIDGQEIAVFYVDEEYHAVANYCIHEGGPLCEGELTGEFGLAEDGFNWTYEETDRIVHCPWHNWRFDITDGSCTDSDQYLVPTYETVVEGGSVFVVR